jgi:hypothetical protein
MVFETTKKFANWAVPIKTDLDRQLREAMRLKEVKYSYKNFSGDPTEFKNLLREYLERTNERNSRMRKLAAYLDSANKATIPFDAVTDAFIIAGGVGTAAKGIKSLAMSPGYLVYDAYYLGKTHDIPGAMGNAVYEALSWLSLGSLPHLINHYTRQAEKYNVKEGSKEFLKSDLLKSIDNKIINFEEEKAKSKKADLEGLAKAA